MRYAYLAGLPLLAACAAGNPLPNGYSGPIATVQDSGHFEDDHRAVLFYVAQFKSKSINQSYSETKHRNYGRGREMNLWTVERAVPAEKVRLLLEGKVLYPAPFEELVHLNSMYSVAQVIELDAKPGAVYVVNGTLRNKDSQVWLEELKTKERVGTPISAK
jgi:hypothetical protein